MSEDLKKMMEDDNFELNDSSLKSVAQAAYVAPDGVTFDDYYDYLRYLDTLEYQRTQGQYDRYRA